MWLSLYAVRQAWDTLCEGTSGDGLPKAEIFTGMQKNLECDSTTSPAQDTPVVCYLTQESQSTQRFQFYPPSQYLSNLDFLGSQLARTTRYQSIDRRYRHVNAFSITIAMKAFTLIDCMRSQHLVQRIECSDGYECI